MGKEDVFFVAQRKAFEAISAKEGVEASNKKFQVNPASITIPAALIQELPLTTASNVMTFVFGTKSPIGTAALNNVILGDNDIAVIYGIQLLIGQGATVNTRIYRSYGPNTQDNVPYNGLISVQLESNVPMINVDTLQFRREHGTDKDQFDGAAVINPQRIITGRISTFNVILTMPDVSTLVFTPNLFVSMRLLIALGQAVAV
jgi:hypothetical protein